jgi:hypothetical protein
MRYSPLVVCKSHYSFLKGVHNISELVTFAVEHELNHLCLADENGLYGAVEFADACDKADIVPLIAAELTDGKRSVIAIARNREGYRRLSEVITHLQLDEPLLSDVVSPISDNLLILCDDSVLLQRWIRRKKTEGLYATPFVSDIARLRSLCSLSDRLPGIARLPAIPVVMLNLFSKEELPLYRVMRAIALNSTVASLPTEEMAVFHGFPLPTLPFQSLLSAGDVLNQCTFQFDFDTLHLPRFVPLSS